MVSTTLEAEAQVLMTTKRPFELLPHHLSDLHSYSSHPQARRQALASLLSFHHAWLGLPVGHSVSVPSDWSILSLEICSLCPHLLSGFESIVLLSKAFSHHPI